MSVEEDRIVEVREVGVVRIFIYVFCLNKIGGEEGCEQKNGMVGFDVEYLLFNSCGFLYQMKLEYIICLLVVLLWKLILKYGFLKNNLYVKERGLIVGVCVV